MDRHGSQHGKLLQGTRCFPFGKSDPSLPDDTLGPEAEDRGAWRAGVQPKPSRTALTEPPEFVVAGGVAGWLGPW